MKLEGYKKDFHEFSGKLSDNTRKLAFAGIAIVWIFKQGEDGVYVIPGILKTAMLLFVLTLSFDLLQYIYQTIIWGLFHRYHEKRLKGHERENVDLLAPCCFNWPSNVLLWSKIISLISGYFFMLKFLW